VATGWSLRVALVWLVGLIGASGLLGLQPVDDENGSVVAWLAVGVVVVTTVALGVALIVERRKWWWVVVAAPVGGFIATVVFSIALYSIPDNGLDSYYPQLLFVEFAVYLLVPLAFGAVLGAVWRVIRVRTRKDASAP